MAAIEVPPHTIVIFSDLSCPFTHVAVHRLFRARTDLGLDAEVRFHHRAFPIELLNRRPGTRIGSDSEIPVLGALEPDAGWQLWQGPDFHYPSSMLLPLEAVAAANAQDLRAGESLDRALRRAFWAESRPIHLHHEILAVATTVAEVDERRLDDDLQHGAHRAQVFADAEIAGSSRVTMSPHLFLPDGTDHANPGLEVHWEGASAAGFPVIDRDDPGVYRTIVERASRPTAPTGRQ